jgi:two-component system, NtrC family, response regulator PilR
MAVADPKKRSTMVTNLSVLIVSNKSREVGLAKTVSGLGLRSVCCQTLSAAKSLVFRQQFGAVLCEDQLTDGTFRGLIAELHSRPRRRCPVVILSHLDDWNSYLAAMRAGAFDYVAHPPNSGELERVLWTALNEFKESQKAVEAIVSENI